MFIEIDNLYKKAESGSYFIKDENRKLYIRPEDVRYLNGGIDKDVTVMTEIVLYSGDRFYTGTSVDVIKKLITGE